MREIMHALALAVVLFVAALCTMVQIGDFNSAMDRLQHDDGVVQPVSSSP